MPQGAPPATETPVAYFAIFMIIAVVLDLVLRYIAFERIESIGIDVGIFATLYSAMEVLKEASVDGGRLREWGVKVVICFLVLFAMTAYHMYLRRRVRELIRDSFDNIHNQVCESDKKNFVNALKNVAEEVIEVDIGEVHQAKKRRRESFRHLFAEPCFSKLEVNQAAGLAGDNSLVLSKATRRLGLAVFFLGGLLSVIVPVIHF